VLKPLEGPDMADHQTSPAGGHPAMDYAEHERTYAMFTTLTKWGTITICGILVLMAIFLI
jgi:hypothetical protein